MSCVWLSAWASTRPKPTDAAHIAVTQTLAQLVGQRQPLLDKRLELDPDAAKGPIGGNFGTALNTDTARWMIFKVVPKARLLVVDPMGFCLLGRLLLQWKELRAGAPLPGRKADEWANALERTGGEGPRRLHLRRMVGSAEVTERHLAGRLRKVLAACGRRGTGLRGTGTGVSCTSWP